MSAVVTFNSVGWPHEILLMFHGYWKKGGRVTLVCRDGTETCMARILMNCKFGQERVRSCRDRQVIEVEFCDLVDLKLVLFFLYGFELKVSPQAATHVENLLTKFGAEFIKATITHDEDGSVTFSTKLF